jgi:putative endonuclease
MNFTPKIYYVYILKCSDESYYTGVTNNLERRLNEHQYGVNEGSYTYFRRPVELKFFEEFKYINQAIEIEKKIKKWSKGKKKALIGIKSRSYQFVKIVVILKTIRIK